MNFISSYMYITFIRFFYLEVLLCYGGGWDGVWECSVKGAFSVTRGRCVCGGRGRWGKVCKGSVMQKRGMGEDGKGSRIAL